jgi:hypothetical protein
MKKYFLLMFLCVSAYSQTISEKWNSLYNRYDYTDSSGNLVGYKGYNSLTQSWEYTNLNTPDPRVALYNEPQDPINLQLLDRALAANQARYDKRQSDYNKGFQDVKGMIDYCRQDIKKSYPTITAQLSNRFENEVVKVLNDAKYDYSRINTQPILEWIAEKYNFIAQDIINK